MSQTQTLSFQIEGRWLTELVRQWFWDENKPYETCRKLIASCCPDGDNDHADTVTRDIIEGRKAFDGINEFELIDDNERIRPISGKIAELMRKNAIQAIKLDILINGINYVDPFSVNKSIAVAKELGIRSADECTEFFMYSQATGERYPSADSVTQSGLWLFEQPDLILEATENNRYTAASPEFWDNIYKLIENNEMFNARNQMYRAYLRLKEEHNTFQPTAVCPTFSPGDAFVSIGRPPKEDPELRSWSGLVSPKGIFYPANYGDHTAVAIQCMDTFYEHLDKSDPIFSLLENGWIALRSSPLTGLYIDDIARHNEVSLWVPTSEQKDVIWKQAMKHQAIDIIPERYF